MTAIGSSRRRILVVAIDGACWTSLDPLLAAGRLPELAALRGAGAHGVLESLLPPLTPVAWAALLTGKRSGRNGIYDWVRPQADGRSFRPVAAADLVGTPIWARLNAAGVRVGLVNVPLTYPPPRLDGFVIGGFMIPDDRARHCHPADLQDEVERRLAPYVASVPAELMDGGDPATLFEVGRRVQAGQVAAALLAVERHPVDLLIVNLMLFDQVNHFEPGGAGVERALECCDADLGALRRGFRPDTVLCFSDHGTRRIGGAFLLGRWLLEHGYQTAADLGSERRGHLNALLAAALRDGLRWRGIGERLARRGLLELWTRAPRAVGDALWRALHRRLPLESYPLWLVPRLDPVRTCVRAGSLNGCLYVDETAAGAPRAEVAARLIDQLGALRDPHSGGALFALHDGGALYGSDAVGRAPDLLLDCTGSSWNLSLGMPPDPLVRDGYFVEPTAGRYGEHAHDGIFAFAGEGIQADSQPGRAMLIDLAATILQLYDVAIPTDYDSQPLTGLLDPRLLAAQPLRRQAGDAGDAAPAAVADVDSADLEQRLRRLGYIE